MGPTHKNLTKSVHSFANSPILNHKNKSKTTNKVPRHHQTVNNIGGGGSNSVDKSCPKEGSSGRNSQNGHHGINSTSVADDIRRKYFEHRLPTIEQENRTYSRVNSSMSSVLSMRQYSMSPVDWSYEDDQDRVEKLQQINSVARADLLEIQEEILALGVQNVMRKVPSSSAGKNFNVRYLNSSSTDGHIKQNPFELLQRKIEQRRATSKLPPL